MTIKQISIFLENKPGQLAGICRALAQAGINIATLSLADTSEFGIVRMIVDDHARGCEVLSKEGYAVRETEVVMATVPDRPGGMAELTEKLDKAGVDIEYSYAYALGTGEKAVLVFKFNDNAKAEAALSTYAK
ncbi:MAG: ACT domain-containing protein [Kiritimatiellia bacterium]|nr:ACT domain-containing protein [Kiritimatiellia bacterium]